jgi:SsrA-binding protein
MDFFAENKRAKFDYQILHAYEAGIELKGFEVKAVKSGHINLAGSFVVPKGEELFLLNADIPPYQPMNTPEGYDSKRSRRLLLNHKEIGELLNKVSGEKLTIIPLKVYNKHGLLKVEIALAKPKKAYDKREAIKKRETDREIERTLKSR